MKIHKTKVLFLILAIASFSYACEKNINDEGPTFKLEHPDLIADVNYEIYSLVIDQLFSSEKIVITQGSKSNVAVSYDNEFFELLENNNPAIDIVLIQNLIDLSSYPIYFDEKFVSQENEIILFPLSEHAYIFDSDDLNAGWERFYGEYENSSGILNLTRIAFNPAQDEALMEFDKVTEDQKGFGKIVYLVKLNNHWTIRDEFHIWSL